MKRKNVDTMLAKGMNFIKFQGQENIFLYFPYLSFFLSTFLLVIHFFLPKLYEKYAHNQFPRNSSLYRVQGSEKIANVLKRIFY